MIKKNKKREGERLVFFFFLRNMSEVIQQKITNKVDRSKKDQPQFKKKIIINFVNYFLNFLKSARAITGRKEERYTHNNNNKITKKQISISCLFIFSFFSFI